MVLLCDKDEDRYVLMKRNGSRHAAGQIQRGTNGSKGNVYRELAETEKTRFRNDYALKSAPFPISSVKEFEENYPEHIYKWAARNRKIHYAIMDHFESADYETDHVEPLPDIERGEDWGSW